MRFILTLSFFIVSITVRAVLPEWWKDLHNWDGISEWTDYMTYTTSFFGPNALPVPEISDGKISKNHNAEISTDFFWGFGDQTQSLSTKLIYTFIPGKLAVCGWGVIAEHYKTTMAIRDERASIIENPEGSILIGDFYISTQIGILGETARRPDLNLEIVLKTASSKMPGGARFFDTPGYYFNLTAGKSMYIKNSIIDELRLAGNIGFLCYQTNTAYQNDAPVFGAKVNIISGNWSWENGIGGYSGWLEKGDKPLVLRSKLYFKNGKIHYFMQYQHSLRDYPFRRLQTGVNIDL